MNTSEPSDQSQPITSPREAQVEGRVCPIQQAHQSQTTLAQKNVERAPFKNAPSKPKPPFDLFPWLYRLLFILIVIIVPIIMTHKSVPQVSFPVLAHDVPAYHIIMQDDVDIKVIDQKTVITNIVLREDGLIGHYTLALHSYYQV